MCSLYTNENLLKPGFISTLKIELCFTLKVLKMMHQICWATLVEHHRYNQKNQPLKKLIPSLWREISNSSWIVTTICLVCTKRIQGIQISKSLIRGFYGNINLNLYIFLCPSMFVENI